MAIEGLDKLAEVMGTKLDAQSPKLDAVLAKLNETSTKPEMAEMKRAGVLTGITEFKPWDVPVGQALVGGFVAVFASELIDGFLARQSTMVKGIVKLGAAGAAVKFGKGLLGSAGSTAVALLLAYDGIRMLVPIDEWAGKAVSPLTKRIGAGLAGKAGMTRMEQEVGNVVANYYKRPFVGR